MILLIQAGRAGTNPIRLRSCAPAQNASVFTYDNASSRQRLSPDNRFLGPAPAPLASLGKRLLRARVKPRFRQKPLFCACGERIPAIAGLCSKVIGCAGEGTNGRCYSARSGINQTGGTVPKNITGNDLPLNATVVGRR